MQILAIGGPYPTAPVNAPTSLSAIPTNTSVAISFTAPTNDGGTPITNYEYSFNLSSWTALSPADAVSPVTISGLTQNTGYTVYLRAVNIVGSGPASAGVSFTTEGVPTGTATITSITNVSRTSLTVNFTVAAGGGAITGYDLYVANQTNAWNSTTASPISVTGLSPSTGYTFYVRAKNAYGVGPQSAGVSATTLASTLVVQTLVVGGGGKGGNAAGAGGNAAGGGGGGLGAVQTGAQGAGSYTITVGGQSGQSVSYFSGSTVVGNGGAAGGNAIGNLGNTGGAGGTGTTATGGKGGDSYSGGSLGQAGGAGPTGTIWNVSAQFSGGGGGGGGQGGAGGAGGGGKGGRGQDVVPPPGENGAAASFWGAGGGGGGYSAGAGGAGYQGGVWISYPTSAATGMSVTGGSISYGGGYTTHHFTGSSSFTITLV